MVLFQGQTPYATNIIGGVRALSTKTFDISDDVSDFQIGGYLILTFEVASVANGAPQDLICTLYQGAIQVPVRFAGADTAPSIKNGYDYTVTLSGTGQDASGYTAVITESAGPRDLSDQIESL